MKAIRCYARLFKLRQQIDKMAEVTRKLMNIIRDEAELRLSDRCIVK